MSDLEAKIRARAHELWIAEGQPDGCAEQHWLAAQAQIMQELATPAAAPKKPRAPRKPKAAKAETPAAEVPAEAAAEAPAKPAKRAAPKLKVVSSQDAA